jgi:glycosyltransferase involved in cell wall biosynthesis
MRVAVITPYHTEPLELLRQCHESVMRQSHPCLHVIVADGSPREEVARWPADHVILPREHNDIGSTPRLIGCYHAIGLGYDAVAFLDADNWYRDDHVAALVRLCEQAGAAFASSGRMLCRLDGSAMAPCYMTDPERFVDTNCMLFARPAFPVLAQWTLMPDYGHLIGDKIMLHHVKASGVRREHNPDATVYYRCGKAGVYEVLGESVPEGVRPVPEYDAAMARWVAEGNPPLK